MDDPIKSTQKRTSIVDGSDHALQHEADVFVVISRPMIHTKAKFHKVAAFCLQCNGKFLQKKKYIMNLYRLIIILGKKSIYPVPMLFKPSDYAIKHHSWDGRTDGQTLL